MKWNQHISRVTLAFGLALVSFVSNSLAEAGLSPLRSRADLVGRLDGLRAKERLDKEGPALHVTGRLVLRNDGGGAAGSSRVRLYLSKDRKLDRSDPRLTELKVQSLRVGERTTIEIDTIASVVDHMTRYLIVRLDAAEDVSESDERNNTLVHDLRSRGAVSSTTSRLEELARSRRSDLRRRGPVERPQRRSADLTAALDSIRLEAQSSRGRPSVLVSGKLQVTNVGHEGARRFAAKLYLAESRERLSEDSLIETFVIRGLEEGAGQEFRFSALVPIAELERKRLIAIIDGEGAIAELNEENNTFVSAILERASSGDAPSSGVLVPSFGKHSLGVGKDNPMGSETVYTNKVSLTVPGPIDVTAGVPKTVTVQVNRYGYDGELMVSFGDIKYHPFIRVKKQGNPMIVPSGTQSLPITIHTLSSTAPGSYSFRTLGMTGYPISDQFCVEEWTLVVGEGEGPIVEDPGAGGGQRDGGQDDPVQDDPPGSETPDSDLPDSDLPDSDLPDNGPPSVAITIQAPTDSSLVPYYSSGQYTNFGVEYGAFFDFNGNGVVDGSQGDPNKPWPRWTDPFGVLSLGSDYANRGAYQGNLIVYATLGNGSRFVAVHFAVQEGGAIAPTLMMVGDTSQQGRILIYQEPLDSAWALWAIEAGSYLPTLLSALLRSAFRWISLAGPLGWDHPAGGKNGIIFDLSGSAV